jgi:hypothetical protein
MSNDIKINNEIEEKANKLAQENKYPEAIEKYKVLLERKKATNGA